MARMVTPRHQAAQRVRYAPEWRPALNAALNTLASFVVYALFLIALAATILFCISDARRRGKPAILVILAVVFFFPFGLIAWLLFRPEPAGTPQRRFDLRIHRVQ